MLTEDHSYTRRRAGGAAGVRAAASRCVDAPGVGHDQRAHPPDVHAPRRAARAEAGRGAAGPDRQILQARMSAARRRLHPGAPRGLPALPRARTRAAGRCT